MTSGGRQRFPHVISVAGIRGGPSGRPLRRQGDRHVVGDPSSRADDNRPWWQRVLWLRPPDPFRRLPPRRNDHMRTTGCDLHVRLAQLSGHGWKGRRGRRGKERPRLAGSGDHGSGEHRYLQFGEDVSAELSGHHDRVHVLTDHRDQSPGRDIDPHRPPETFFVFRSGIGEVT